MPGGVASRTRTNGNHSRHMYERTVVKLRIGTEDIFVDVDASCSGPCALVLVSCTSYIKHVSETQYHIYEEGNDAGGGG